MPLKSGKLTPQERMFVQHMAETHDATYAATKAGFAGDKRQAGWRQMNKPAISSEVHARTMALLFNEGRPAAVRALVDIAGDVRLKPADRIKASSVILAHTPDVPADASDPTMLDSATLRRMNVEALREMGYVIGPGPIEDAQLVEVQDEPDEGVFG